MTKKRNNRPRPLAPLPQDSALRSRKRARQVTTQFHKYTEQLDLAIARARAAGIKEEDFEEPSTTCDGEDINGFSKNVEGDRDRYAEPLDEAVNSLGDRKEPKPDRDRLLNEVKKWQAKILEIGGREEYQRASQMNTSLFSTSKWVLGVLGRWGWLDGLRILPDGDSSGSVVLENDSSSQNDDSQGLDNPEIKRRKKRKVPRRDVLLLEIGAINTQLLDAAARTRTHATTQQTSQKSNEPNNISTVLQNQRVHRLTVRAIDIRSTDPRIQQLDFFELPLPGTNIHDKNKHDQPYDVLVNSMVINCVTTPEQRGRMLALCYHHLRPGGVCFLTLPKLCLTQSKYMSRGYFEEILTKGVGFEILEEVGKDSPKVAFFVLKRPEMEVVESDGAKNANPTGKSKVGCHSMKRKFNGKFTRMNVLHSGKQFRNTFAVKLNEEEVSGSAFFNS